ncbi:MAG: glycosyltransferase 87 family protein [Myxococcota bacterium]
MGEPTLSWQRPRWPSWLALGAVLALLTVLKAYGVRPALSDENIYFYMATRVVAGRMPYADFSFAHPPVHLMLGVPVALLHPTLVAFKLIPVIAILVTCAAAWLVARGPGGTRWHEVRGALGALALTASHDVLRSSSHFTGSTEACAFLVVGVAALVFRRAAWCGVMFGLAAGVALYTAPSAAVMLALLLVGDRELGKRAIIACAITVASWNLLGLLLGGARFLDDVYGYHLGKTSSPDAFSNALIMVCFHQTPLFLAVLPAATALFTSNVPWRRHAWLAHPWVLCVGGGVASLLFLATQPRVFHFYLLPMLTLWAPLLGVAAAETLRAALHRRGNAVVALAVAWGVVLLVHNEVYRAVPYAKREWGTSHSYTWEPVPALGPINDVVRALFWSDVRVIGRDYSGITYALWHESRAFDAAFALAQEVQRQTTPEQTLLGDSLVAPLIALLAERRLAQDRADTNTQRYASGRDRIDDVLRGAEADNLGAVVVSPGKRFASLPGVREWLSERFTRVASYPDHEEKGVVELWVRR